MKTTPERLGVAAAILLSISACDLVTPEAEDPVTQRAYQVQADIEALIGGSMAGWWRSSHGPEPGAALSTAADAHTSSWRNWGMLDAGAEPRTATVLTPGSTYDVVGVPWTELHRTLASVRDGMLGIEAGGLAGLDESVRLRAVAFGRFMQGLALGQLAQLFDRAFILDESADPASVELSPYPEVMEAALARLDDALEAASGRGFAIPAHWVGFDRVLYREDFVELVHSHRARLAISVARTPAERAAVDWSVVLADARAGLDEPWGGRYDGDYEDNWGWSMDKLFAGVHPLWARIDYRTLGPADASGAYQAWLATPPAQRQPFLIDTDDRRVTGPSATDDGSLVRWAGDPIFRPERGTDHFSFYADRRWVGLLEAEGEGFHPDFVPRELELIEAEALYRLGRRAEAMVIVNRTRVPAGLPAITSTSGPVPGGARCVPRRADGACGDLWDALRYEKRIELFHYGAFTEYLDDRGWGDLVPGTFLHFPAVGTSAVGLVNEIYGRTDDGSFANDVSAGALSAKREAYEAFDRGRAANPGAVAGN